LQSSIAEKIKAQDDLQKAHDLLDARVQERTKQLKVEMGARKEAEVQFKAIASERTRIAQELHDTLLQGFTGIGLKLDAWANNLPASLAIDKEQLQKILGQSDEYLAEARRAVWELRSPSLEKLGDFSKALLRVSERTLQGTDIRLQFSTSGDACKPAQAVEDNCLRICEEALRNSVKHACATLVEVNLQYTSNELRLQIRDNGCGFDPRGPDGSKDGHFGLIGIRERAKFMNAFLSLKSKPGQGTEILVTVPLSEDTPRHDPSFTTTRLPPGTASAKS
jgi:signal transduction histidine kinase